MKQNIIDTIHELGGTCACKGNNLLEDIKSIQFSKSYLIQSFEDFLSDELYKKIRNHDIIDESMISYPRIKFICQLFTPLLKGSKDYEEWSTYFDEIKQTISSQIQDVSYEFIIIGETDSYPNYYFIDATDKNIDNPTVYSSDHEAYFIEIEKVGTLEDYFKMYVNERMFLEVIHEMQQEN